MYYTHENRESLDAWQAWAIPCVLVSHVPCHVLAHLHLKKKKKFTIIILEKQI